MDNSLEAFSSNPRYSPSGLEAEIENEELALAKKVDSEQAAVADLQQEPPKVENQEGFDMMGMHEKILGVVDNATRVPRDIVGGVTKAIDNTMSLAIGRENVDAANQWLKDEMPELVKITSSFEKGIAPQGTVSEVTQELSQFAIPFGAYMKGLKALSVASGVEAGAFTTGFLSDIITSGTALDPHVERLSTMARDMGVDNKIVGWLADNENETDSEGRLKNILENAGLGVGIAASFASVILPLKGMWRLSKMPKKPVKAKKKIAADKTETLTPKDDLVVANKYENGIVSGERGALHFSVMREDKGKLLESGFTDSKGNFYNRNEAIEYAKKATPSVKGMDETVSPRYSGLDAKDLNFARTGDEMPLLKKETEQKSKKLNDKMDSIIKELKDL